MIDVDTNKDCKTAFARAKRLIAERKKEFNRIPEIQELDNGNILIEFFEHWGTYWSNLKRRDFESINGTAKNVVAIYCEAGNKIEIDNHFKDKTYIIINGEIEFQFPDEKKYNVSSFQTIKTPANIDYNIDVIRDTYVIVVE